MALLLLLAQVYLGLIFFFFIKSARYIGPKFDFKKWKKENLVSLLWAAIGAFLLSLIYFVDPKAMSFVLKYVGYDLESGMQLTGVGLGMIFGFATRELMKRKAEKPAPKVHTPPEV